jgi:hypothetical protein
MLKSKFVLALTTTLLAGSNAMAGSADFSKIDSNNDGKITLEEGMKIHPDWTMDAFKALDIDGDNALNELEYAKVQATAPALDQNDTTASNTPIAKTDPNAIVATNVVRRNGPANYLDAVGPNDVLASKLIGMRVYAVNADLDESKTYTADNRKDWADVGEINDVVLDLNGDIKAVVLGVGGFLGLGEKDVAVEMSSLRKVRESADSNDWFLVVNTTKDMLTNAPAYAVSKKS